MLRKNLSLRQQTSYHTLSCGCCCKRNSAFIYTDINQVGLWHVVMVFCICIRCEVYCPLNSIIMSKKYAFEENNDFFQLKIFWKSYQNFNIFYVLSSTVIFNSIFTMPIYYLAALPLACYHNLHPAQKLFTMGFSFDFNPSDFHSRCHTQCTFKML